jgi:hypothetical protein
VALEDETVGEIGSVYTYVDVPDFFTEFVSIGGVFLGVRPAVPDGRDSLFGDLIPVWPTTNREFGRQETVTAAAMLYQGVGHQLMPGYLTAEIQDDHGRRVFRHEARLIPEAYGTNRATAFSLEVPLSRLQPGEHLLTVSARHGSATARRDARFRVQ